MNLLGTCLQLSDAAGNLTNASQGTVLGVILKSAITGSLTITGVSQSDGSAQSWVIAPASSGWQAAPGSTKFWRSLDYSLSNVGADAGKAIACFVQT